MNDHVIQLIGLVIGYLVVRNFLFRKKGKKKMNFRKRYELRKKEKTNEKH